MHDTGRPLSVLVVDDDPDTAGSTAELLALYGHTVRVAAGGDEALRSAAASPPDVVLLDLWMPGMHGCELARRLAGRTGGQPPVVVALTGCSTDTDRKCAAAAGVHLYMLKPVDPAVLVGVLARFKDALAASSPPTRGTDAAPAATSPRMLCHAHHG
jgi:CheY-like chemotaxis protein